MELEQILETAVQSCRLDRSAAVLVGVSGGPDSLSLLDALARLRFPVVAAHFDHRLRPGSDQEAELVHAAADGLGVPFASGSGDAAGYAREARLSIEASARALRYRFLFEQARRFHAQAVAVGHTADDQVETVLLHLLRGAGLDGLLGMQYHSRMPCWDAEIALVRPLLGVWREETLAYCQERGLSPVFDPSNQDVAYLRNRVRHELIPLLESYQPQARRNLWRTAQVLAGEDAIISAVVEEAWRDCLVEQRVGAVLLHQGAFLHLPVGLRRRVLRKAIADLRDVDFETVERAVQFASRTHGGQVDLVRGLRMYIENGTLVIAGYTLPADTGWPQLEPAAEPSLPIPGEVALPGGWRLASRWVEGEELPHFPAGDASVWEAWLDADALPAGLCLRRARAGDRFQPLGMDGRSVKLSDFWINEKLPRRARQAWPLLATEDAILWVPGFRLAHPYRVQTNTRKALHVRLFRVLEDALV